MVNKRKQSICAYTLLVLAILCILIGFLGIKINQTNAPVPGNFFIDFCRRMDMPLTITGIILLIAAFALLACIVYMLFRPYMESNKLTVR